MKNMIRGISVILLAIIALPAYTAGHGDHLWVLSNAESKVSYGSIKKNVVGEVNHFKRVSGDISKQGDVTVNIDLTSVETYIDIRNQRMMKHVFGESTTTATLQAKIDLSAIDQLSVGATDIVDVSGTLTLSGNTVEIDTSMMIARLAKDRLLAVTDEMIMVKTQDLGIDDGVSQLMEIAKLPGITRVAPVTLRLVFTQHGKALSHSHPPKTPEQPVANEVASHTGNAAAGKKVYRQCLACHNIKDETSSSFGPHLVNIMGRKAGAVDGFNYSKALKNANLVWDKTTLAAFLENPASNLPGNRMPFSGIKDPKAIEDLLAYLESESQ